MKISRLLVALLAAIAALFVGPGSAQAGMDNQQSLVDGKGRTMSIQQWDTFLDGVFPLDRNRLTREWFHSGKAMYNVVGPGAGDDHQASRPPSRAHRAASARASAPSSLPVRTTSRIRDDAIGQSPLRK